MRLFSQFILRRMVQEPLRSGTTAFGIALGVAVVVAIQLTNGSSLAGFRTALDTVSGRTALEVVSAAGRFDETRLPTLGWLREYGAVSPVVEGQFVWRRAGQPTESLRVLGVDLLRDRALRDYTLVEWEAGRDQPTAAEFVALLLDPSSAVLTSKFAKAQGLRVGSTLEVGNGDRLVTLTVRGLLADDGPARVLDGRFVLMDIAGAQLALARLGQIDRIDLRLPEGVDTDTTAAAITTRLPAGLQVQRPSQRGRQVEQMLAAFHLNLTALSYVALLVGLYLVYNTVSVSVLARRPEIGTLRALGVRRGQVRALFLGEAALLASVGGALGLVLGRLLADSAVALTSTTVSTLYIATAAAPPALTFGHVLLAAITSVPLSLVAAFVPAQEASRVPPVAAIRGADASGQSPAVRWGWVVAAVLLLAAGGWLATRGPVAGLPLFGYAAVAAIILGASLLVPAILFVVTRALDRPARLAPVEGWLAVTNIFAAIPRVSISVAALAVSLSMMVAIAVMIGSFRETVAYWVSQTLQADLFVAPGARQQPGTEETIAPDVVTRIAADAQVEAIDRFRFLDVPFRDGLIRGGGADFGVLLAHGRLLFKAPANAREAMREAIGQDSAVVSESLSLKYHLQPGDTIELPTPGGPARLRVVAVYFDYSSDRGVAMMDRATFVRLYGDEQASGLSVYLRPGTDPEAARTRLLAALGDETRVVINTQAWLRSEVLRIFDSTFAITYALEIIAIAVAMLGVTGTLLTLMLERQGELTMLRLLGTTRGQMRRLLVGEAVIIGSIGQAIGLAVGLALSLVLIYVVNVQSFGWTIQFHLPWAFLVQSTVLTVVATGLAGLYPARRAARLVMKEDE